MTSQRPKTKHACDQCRFRKLKCDGTQPCERCQKMDFSCSFLHTSRPKNIRSKVNLLRTTSETSGSSQAIVAPMSNPENPQIQSPKSNELRTSQEGENATDPSLQPSFSPQSRQDCGIWSPRVLSDVEVRQTNSAIDVTAQSFHTHLHTPDVNDRHQLDLDVDGSDHRSSIHEDPYIAIESPQSSTIIHWPREFKEEELLQYVEIFFDRVHSTLPIVDRVVLYEGLVLRRHHEDAGFGSMVLSLSAFSLVQPVYIQECTSMSSRVRLAKEMLSAAAHLRSSYAFGEKIALDDVVTSFFMFATLLGMELHTAAWLKLREAIECGMFLGLDRPERYENLPIKESSRRLRVFLVLSVTERGFALQRNHPISFNGRNVQRMQGIVDLVEDSTTNNSSGIVIQDERSVALLFGLLNLMKLFDSIDEVNISCWNKSCSSSLQSCAKLDAARVIKAHDAIERALRVSDQSAGPTSSPLTDSIAGTLNGQGRSKLDQLQWADCFVLQQWLLVRLWASCLTHDLLHETSEMDFLRPSYAATIAEFTLQECRKLPLSVLEAHGTGMVERIYDIAMGVVMAMQFSTIFRSGSPERHSGQVLQQYFELLSKLRGGAHPFTAALREALRSFDGKEAG